MPKVDILIVGEDVGEETDQFQKYASTTTLVRTDDGNIVVDPGTHKSPKEYVDSLAEFGLKFEDVDYVFTTHEHLDHTRDIALFPNATVIDRLGFHKADEHRFFEDEEYEVAPGVTRIATPGHGLNHSSLLVDTDIGVVCVAGDVWWYEDLSPEEDPYATSTKELKESREKVLKLADFIIPGHGGMVINNRKG